MEPVAEAKVGTPRPLQWADWHHESMAPIGPLEATGSMVPIGPLARNGRPPGKIELTTGMGGRASPHQRSKLNSSGRVEKGGGNHKIVSSFVVMTGFSPLSDSKLHLMVFPSRGGPTNISRVGEPEFQRCHFSIKNLKIENTLNKCVFAKSVPLPGKT